MKCASDLVLWAREVRYGKGLDLSLQAQASYIHIKKVLYRSLAKLSYAIGETDWLRT